MKPHKDKNQQFSLLACFNCPAIRLFPDYKIVELNEAALTVFGWKREVVVGEDFCALLKTQQIQNPIPEQFSWFENKQPLENIETSIRNKNQDITLVWKISPLFDDNNRLTEIILTGNDITLQKKLEDKVYELDSVIAQMPGNVYWFDKGLAYLGCNENSAKTLRMSREEAIGKNFKTILKNVKNISPAVIDEWVQDGLDIIETKAPKLNIKESPFVGPNDEMIHTISDKIPLFDKRGDFYGVVGISMDITKQVKMEEALYIAIENTKAANNGLTLMTGSVVHELRTPLVSVNLAISTIKQYLPELISAYQLASDNNLPAKEILPSDLPMLVRCAENIQTEIKSANMFIDMLLLNLTEPKISAENIQDCSIKQCIETALERYPLAENEKDIIIFEPRDDFIFRGNQLLTIHILFNLLKNALYYIKSAGKGEIYIWLETGEQANKLHFKDTAKGISPEVLPHVFERFYSNTQGGSGIGLAFCKMTMELFGGEIHCESVEGDYAEFVLSFPIS